MPSFAFISTLALALLSAAPSMAQTPPRGRPNHADLFGYPHNLPKPAPGQPRQRMTPGGYVDTRPANQGSECKYNNQCVSSLANSRAVCDNGTCSFACLGNTQYNGSTCAGQIIAPRCSFDRQCPTSVENATGVCYSGRCSFSCASGFYANGSQCSKSDDTCGGQTCPQVPGGYSVCVNGQCQQRCEAQLGFKQYCNADNSVCTCTNTDSDVQNCGAPGNQCAGGYNGKGVSYCANGVCGLSCHRLTRVQPRDGGAAYCS